MSVTEGAVDEALYELNRGIKNFVSFEEIIKKLDNDVLLLLFSLKQWTGEFKSSRVI